MKTLTEIADNCGTDKGSWAHNFTDFYEQSLVPLKNRENLRVLEIGVDRGASIRMWNEFFQGKAEVFGVDIFDKSDLEVFELPNVHFIEADQSKEEDLYRIVREAGNQPFDLIVDDGSHNMYDQLISLKVLSSYVKSSGFYILEDLHTSLWPDWGGDYTQSALRFLIEGETNINIDLNELQDRIESVTIYNQMPFGQHITSLISFKNSL